jgi:tetratricopeptide (TPR) repeat protein
MGPSPRGRRLRALAFAALLLIPPALLRWAYHLEIRDDPYMQWPLVVSFVHDDFARDLAVGGGPWILLRSPWYAVFLSGIYTVLGGPWGARLVQWTLGCVACVLVYHLARRIAGPAAAWFAYACAVLYGPSLFYEGELLEPSVASFLMLCGLAAVVTASDSSPPRPLRLAAAGGALGLAAMIRPDHAAALPFMAAAVALIHGSPGERARRAAWIVAGSVPGLLLVAWPGLLLNVKENRAGINTSLAFYLGNRHGADGHRSFYREGAELPTTDPAARAGHMTGLDLEGIRLAQAATGGGLDTVAPWWWARSREEILAHPVSWVTLLGRKALMFCSGFLMTTQKDLYMARHESRILSALIHPGPLLIPLGLLVPLAAAAAARPRTSWRTAALLSAPAGALATTLLFTHDARFQHGASMAVVVLAGAGLVALVEGWRQRRAGVLATAALFLLLANVDLAGTHRIPVAEESFRRGIMHLEQGRPAAATGWFVRAIEADPSGIPSLDSLAAACRRVPSCDGEIAALQRIRTAPGAGVELDLALAGLLQQAGRLDEARDAARHARDLAPGRAEPHALLARVEAAAGDTEASMAALSQGLLRLPDDAGLRMDLGRSLMAQGRFEEALPYLRRVAEATQGEEAFAASAWALASLGRLDESAAVLSDGLSIHPASVPMMGLLAQVRGRQGRLEDEQRLYRALLVIEPGHAEALWRLSLSLRASGDNAGADLAAEQAARAGHPEASRRVRAGKSTGDP